MSEDTKEHKHEVHHEHKEGNHHEHKEAHHKHHDTHHEHSPKKKTSKLDMWRFATAIAVILLIISIITGGFGLKSGTVADSSVVALDKDAAANKAVDYINDNLLQPGTTAELKSVEEKNDLYVMKMDIAGREYESYITKDGVYMFPNGFNMDEPIEAPEPAEQPAQDIPKTDKPKVELFVMSHCPYGTQAEKGMLPVAKLLGDKIDFNVKFVYYAMHGETEVKEQLNQYCIQDEQNDQYLDYLQCFLEAGETESCLDEVGIDRTKLDACVDAIDKEFSILDNLADQSTWLNGRFPLFDIDKADNEKYGVGGSPTVVINENVVGVNRDPASYLKAVCGAFSTPPEECETEFPSAAPSPGFGFSETDSAAIGQCG